MPLYEYKCLKCGELVETIQKFSDPPYVICPHCGGELKKLISAPAIQFKGSGFYLTDYGRAGSDTAKKEGGKESTPAKESAPAKEGSSPTSGKESPASKESAPAKEKSSKPKPPSD